MPEACFQHDVARRHRLREAGGRAEGAETKGRPLTRSLRVEDAQQSRADGASVGHARAWMKPRARGSLADQGSDAHRYARTIEVCGHNAVYLWPSRVVTHSKLQ